MFNYKKTRIPHFRRFVLQNFPFIEQDFDALTDYELICKVVEYLNKVITSQNALISEMERYENEIDGKFNNLVQLFNELKDFVDNYFDNLDVQDEINNKLDQMAESGQLADIIADYIKLKGILAYDTVADLKNANNVVNGSFVETYGYYEKGDSGGAKYKIRNVTNDDTVDESLLIEISSDPQNLLVAELVLNNEMHIRQFGVKGDGETDDTDKFNIAINNTKELIIDPGTYLVDKFQPTENQIINGINNPIILTKGTAPQAELNDGNKLFNITLKSNSTDLAWNRCNINNKDNITIKDCSFINFRHNSQAPNAWGLLLANCNNVLIEKCYFDNNSQSDLALVNGCNNISINQCSGTNLFINIEPSNLNPRNDNIYINNSKIHQLNLLENNYQGNATENVSINNCTIDILKYDGSTSCFTNCIIKDVINEVSSNIMYGGILKLVNSMNLSKNLLEDPYLDTYNNDTSSTNAWTASYLATSLSETLSTIKDNDGILTALNYNNSDISGRIRHQPVTVSSGEKYILRVNSKANYPEGSDNVSLNFEILWFDNDNQIVKHEGISFNRSAVGTSTKLTEQSAVLVVPEGSTKLEIRINIGFYPSTFSMMNDVKSILIRSVELFKFNGGENSNTIPSLPIRNHRIFELDNLPNINYNKFFIGDKLYYKTPSTYIGAVATTDGYGNNANWKNFGALAS